MSEQAAETKPATADFSDRSDFVNADRGFVGTLEPMVVKAADGRVVWDMDSWGFLDGDCPDTVNPSLWRQAQLTAKHGLYEVTDGIYQVRGFEMSNMTLVESDHGVIVIDPLISQEVAAAALALYRQHRGDRAVTAVIYTHAHLDHFGGVLGVVDEDTSVPILAPEHFLEHAVSENVYAGTAMLRRSYYYAAIGLPKSATGTLGIGLGAGGSTGTPGLIAPTHYITRTGQQEVLDGVRIVFQLTPGTECPAEMNFCFPDKRALCMAENATHNLHNLLTLRGAQVRDPRIWSRYLAEAIDLFARDADVAFASHHWPTWGTDRDRRLPDRAAGPVRLPARPDAAADQPGLHPQRDRRNDRAAARAGPGVAHTWLLRVGQSQRQGHLPALHRLVRRQPRPPVAASAGGGRDTVRGSLRRH